MRVDTAEIQQRIRAWLEKPVREAVRDEVNRLLTEPDTLGGKNVRLLIGRAARSAAKDYMDELEQQVRENA